MTEERVSYLGDSPQGNGDTLVREEGNGLRRYFTEIPNIILDMDLDIFAFRLYAHLKRVAGAEGECYQSTATLARQCGMSKPKISQAKQILATANLIRIEARDREKGQTDIITIVDIWQENFANYSKSKRTEGGVHHVEGGVHHVEGGVHHVEGGVHHVVREEEPTNKKQPNNKKNPNEETAPSSSSTRSARGRKKKGATPPHPMTDAIKDAYVKAVGHKLPPSAFRTISPDAKFAAEQGITPEEIEKTYAIMKSEEWWKGKTVSLKAVLGKIANSKETMRNREEADDGQAEDNGGWDADEVAAIQAARDAGDRELAGQIIREGNRKWLEKHRMSQVQGRGLDDRRT